MTDNDPRAVQTVDIGRDSAAAGGTEDRHEILRMHYRGWVADVDGGKITLPAQRWRPGMDPADLMVCLAAAATKARANTPAPPAKRSRDTQLHQAVKITQVMRRLRQITAEQWHPFKFDIYQCISQAWEESDREVPHTELVRRVRAELPNRDELLIDFNDTTRRRQHMVELIDRAVRRAELAAERIESAEATPDAGARNVA